MSRCKSLVTAVIAATCLPLTALLAALHSGPMIGYTTMAEVLIWCQTTGPAEVRIEYWPQSDPDDLRRTAPETTTRQDGYVAKCLADQVAAGTRYGYRVLVNGEAVQPRYRPEFREGAIPLAFATPPNWRFREEGHRIFDFTVAFGSCAYINEPEGGYDRMGGDPYGGDYRIFESIYETSPDVFIWLGDNIYYRQPDWTSRTGMIHRWSHDRAIPHLRPLLATVPQYATWDDHDYGPNDAGRAFWHKELATEIFTLFHGNPSAGLPELPGIFTYFAYGDVHFYLLDNRTYRSEPALNLKPFDQQPSQLGKEQIDWLVESMKYHRKQARSSYPANFHVVALGNQILSPYSRDTLQKVPGEWQYLFDRMVAEEMHNVLFITGDVHFGEVSRMDYEGGGQPGVPGKAGEEGTTYRFMEVTSSPLTAGPWPGSPASANPYRVDLFPGETDRVGQRNFASLSFEGPLTKRVAVIRYYDSDGNLLNQKPGAPEGTPTDASRIPAVNPNLSPRLYR